MGGLPLGRSGLQGMSLTPFPVRKKRSREINNVEGSLRGGLKANPQLSTSILSWGPEPGRGSRSSRLLNVACVMGQVLEGSCACPCGSALTWVSSPTELQEGFLRGQVSCDQSAPSSGRQAGYIMSLK